MRGGTSDRSEGDSVEKSRIILLDKNMQVRNGQCTHKKNLVFRYRFIETFMVKFMLILYLSLAGW